MKLGLDEDGILGSLASFCTQIYRSFVFSFWQAHRILCFTRMNYSFIFLLCTVVIICSISPVYCMMSQIFFICFVLWSNCYWSVCQATVSEVQNPKVQGEVWCSAGSRDFTASAASCHAPSCSMSPDAQGMWNLTLRDYTHWALKSWEVNNSFITCSGWGLPVALWRQGQGRE